ncbi:MULTISPECIES: MFS transporter [Pandoraea]|uniref:MFS transporter n=1 Tax=Pandoraea TaxID=93217 RepID=UPI001F5D1423|nr:MULTISPECIES: MFS transporter [Pandoraea]MCI3208631.1 MFS transporter [Pandoraea sp. LA3]MDN4586660.1 MFS transporter [Pandoraea capi]
MRPRNRDRRPSRGTVIAATTIGNALEFFDFTVFGFLTLTIGRLFFPTLTPYGQVLSTVATFGVGFIMRPLGGIAIGAYADRFGRKKAMTLTIFLMALGCGVIAFTPTYAQIGVAASVTIVLARLIQGFSAGGEVGAATTLLVEYATPTTRSFMASWQFASQGLGILLAAACVGGLSYLSSPQWMAHWGWRVPFLLGMLIAPVGMYLRSHLDESLEHPRRDARSSLTILCTEHGKTILCAILCGMGRTTAAYVVTFYLPTYAINELGFSPTTALFSAAFAGLVTFASAAPIGIWSDRVGRKPLIVGGGITLALLIYPAFFWLNARPDWIVLFVVVGALILALGLQSVPGTTMLPEMFPKSVRVSGMSLVYSISVAVFGGFSPLVSNWITHATGSKLAPAWYMLVMVLLSLLGLFGLKDHNGKEIDSTNDTGATTPDAMPPAPQKTDPISHLHVPAHDGKSRIADGFDETSIRVSDPF